MPNILIIDDNPDILSANVSHLTDQGFTVTTADTGKKVMSALKEKQFDCIILDTLLPDLDSIAFCKSARTVIKAPIIFLTCMDDIDDKVNDLMSGCDDYMTKPYSLKELATRVRILIRRGEMNHTPQNADFYIDHDNRMIHTREKNVFLSEKEFGLFMLLYENPDTVFDKEEILNKVWTDSNADSGTVAVHISKLRRKIGFAVKYIGRIQSDYGSGYRLALPVTEGVGEE